MPPADFTQFGARRVSKYEEPSILLVDVHANTAAGTTRFGVSAPKARGMLYCNFDRQLKNVRGLENLIGDARLEEIDCTRWTRSGADEAKAKEQAAGVIKRLSGAVRHAIENKFSTVVIDKATDLHDCLPFAFWGKPEFVRKAGNRVFKDTKPLDVWWRQFFQRFKSPDCETNLVLIHRQGERYWNDKPTGQPKSRGWSDVDFECTVSVTLSKDFLDEDGERREGSDKFAMSVAKCTFKTSLEGKVFRGKEVAFGTLATLIAPKRPPQHWK